MSFIINPLTNRPVKVGSRKYNQLVRSGHIIPQEDQQTPTLEIKKEDKPTG